MTTTYPAPGVSARYDGREDQNPDLAVSALPARAVAVLDALRDGQGNGWGWSVLWDASAAGHAFVVVRGVHRPTGAGIDMSWHTRDTGTLRLFGCIIRGARGRWHDASAKAAIELVRSTS